MKKSLFLCIGLCLLLSQQTFSQATCATAFNLPFYPFQVASNTCPYGNDYGAQCGGTINAEEFVFKVDITAALAGVYNFSVSASGGSDRQISLSNAGICPPGATCKAFATATAATTNGPYMTGVTLPVGTYYLFVERATCGGFVLDVVKQSGLPIDLVYFDGINQGHVNLLKWKTLSEVNNDFFTVESSIDGEDFASIGIVKGAGNSSSPLYYSLADKNPSPVTYYRLKQTDFNGQYSYSETIVLKVPGINIINIYPNPADDTFQYLLTSSEDADVNVNVVDVLGRTIRTETFGIFSGTNKKELTISGLSQGSYMLQVSTTSGIYTTQRQFMVK